MIHTDGTPTIASGVSRQPAHPRVKPQYARSLAAFYARHGTPCSICRVARDYHYPTTSHEYQPTLCIEHGLPTIHQNGDCNVVRDAR